MSAQSEPTRMHQLSVHQGLQCSSGSLHVALLTEICANLDIGGKNSEPRGVIKNRNLPGPLSVSRPRFSMCQFSSVQSLCCVWLFATPWTTACKASVHHQLPESTQNHVHWVGDAIQPSHPLLSPSPPVLNLSQHQGLFKWVSSSHQVAKALEFQLQHQSFQWILRTDLL